MSKKQPDFRGQHPTIRDAARGRLRNILIGVGSAFDLQGLDEADLRRARALLVRKDEEAMRDDWRAVGKDLEDALAGFRP